MIKFVTFCCGAILLLAMLVAAPSAWAALSNLGIPIAPHGFPAFYSDANGLALEPCLPADQFGQDTEGNPVPAGNSTRPELCFFDPIDPANPDSVKLGVGGESFWWMGDATMDMPGGGRAVLVLGLEGAFGGAGEPADGQQISFGRVRIRIDTPTAGTYTVTYPYGVEVFQNVPAGTRAINVTFDIGAINQLTPVLGFSGALSSALGPFLTWPSYASDPSLQVAEIDPGTGLPTGTILEQYVGDPNVPHVVTGSTTGNNFFRVQGPNGLDVQTDLFNVMGKIYDPGVPRVAHIFPDAPLPNLFAAGPVNRTATVDLLPAPEPGVTGVDNTGYPVGFPIWYQDAVLVTDSNGDPVIDAVTGRQLREGGLQLTYCPPTDAMCISAPVDPADPNSVALRVGEEGFFWTADAFINADTPDVTNLPAGLDGLLVVAIEGAFGGAGTPFEGQQIAFARIRIRVDTPVAGTYTITHPYGIEVFENVPAGTRAINQTIDVMIADPANPDSSFVGALYGQIGPQFLTWPDFANRDPLFLEANPEYVGLQRLFDPTDELSPLVQYIGDPAVEHVVTGSPTGNNIFRIEGPDGIDVETALFAVTGKVYDDATFNVVPNPAVPVANPDAATLDLAQAASVTIDVTANDVTDPVGAPVTVAVTTAPVDGTTVVNADGTITYTPDAALAAAGGVDTFAYNITITGSNPALVSNNAVVTVTVIPVETITVDRANFDTRRLRLDIRGTTNATGTLTIHAGASAAGPVLGTTTPRNGKWSFRGTATGNLSSITVVSPQNTIVTSAVQAR